MSQPEATSPTVPTSKRRAIWLWVLGTVLMLALGCYLAFRVASHATPRTDDTLGTVTNVAGAVPLAEFTSADTRRWRSVPHGTQVCDGVTFLCNGAIRTAGLNAAREGNHYPGAVLGVPVNRRGSRIHLLQAAENTTDTTDGSLYGRFVVHYASGESRKFELLLGIHGDDWFQSKRNPNDPAADPNSKVAWLQRRAGDGMVIRIYHTALANPLPETVITAIDFISPLSEANLLLFGLTVDDDPRPLAPAYGASETIGDAARDSIVFSVQDAAGRPATGASLAWTAQGSRIRVDFPPFPANLQGEVTIEVPRTFIREILYKASGPDGSSAAGELRPEATGSFPLRPVIKLALSEGKP